MNPQPNNCWNFEGVDAMDLQAGGGMAQGLSTNDLAALFVTAPANQDMNVYFPDHTTQSYVLGGGTPMEGLPAQRGLWNEFEQPMGVSVVPPTSYGTHNEGMEWSTSLRLFENRDGPNTTLGRASVPSPTSGDNGLGLNAHVNASMGLGNNTLGQSTFMVLATSNNTLGQSALQNTSTAPNCSVAGQGVPGGSAALGPAGSENLPITLPASLGSEAPAKSKSRLGTSTLSERNPGVPVQPIRVHVQKEKTAEELEVSKAEQLERQTRKEGILAVVEEFGEYRESKVELLVNKFKLDYPSARAYLHHAPTKTTRKISVRTAYVSDKCKTLNAGRAVGTKLGIHEVQKMTSNEEIDALSDEQKAELLAWTNSARELKITGLRASNTAAQADLRGNMNRWSVEYRNAGIRTGSYTVTHKKIARSHSGVTLSLPS
ncbi:hypothetical protein BDN72DRAFT_906960, partial [Pluteus cervinus]